MLFGFSIGKSREIFSKSCQYKDKDEYKDENKDKDKDKYKDENNQKQAKQKQKRLILLSGKPDERE